MNILLQSLMSINKKVTVQAKQILAQLRAILEKFPLTFLFVRYVKSKLSAFSNGTYQKYLCLYPCKLFVWAILFSRCPSVFPSVCPSFRDTLVFP